MQYAWTHPEAFEPSRRACDLAAAEDVVIAVGEEYDAEPEPEHEQGRVGCCKRVHATPGRTS
jgi:hypothetical protein